MLQIKYICLLLILSLNAACSRHALHDAQTIVSQADSLWHAGQMYGIDHGDSTSLAQAYVTLGKIPFVQCTSSLCSSYAHACYHYGRLLRKKDDPVSAMQVFINATHSHTSDYHILGRIYSNMGDLCHLAGDYPLSYDMFEKSGNSFLKNGDTLLYYYDINNMALELAVQGKKDSTLLLIRKIEKECADDNVLRLTLGTKAVACKKAAKYDSVLFYTSQMLQYNSNDSYAILNRAQAYSFLGMKDSAVYYAKKIINQKELFTLNGALYILTNDDETKDKESIRETAAARADTQKLIEIQQGKLSQATQLLQQDLNRKPNFIKISLIGLGIIAIFLLLWLAMIRLNRKHKQINEKINYQLVQEENLQLQAADYYKKQIADLENSCEALRKSKHLKKDLNWDDYNSMCSAVNLHMNGLANKLMKFPNISSNDIRLCTLVLLDISYSEIANMLNLSPKSIAKLKSITAHKLNTTMKDLRTTLIEIVCEN